MMLPNLQKLDRKVYTRCFSTTFWYADVNFNDRGVTLLNIDPDAFDAYLSKQTSTLSSPYDCAQGLIDSAADQVNDSIHEFIDSFTVPNASPDCEPFLSQFILYQSN